jgi:hypothetical protein
MVTIGRNQIMGQNKAKRHLLSSYKAFTRKLLLILRQNLIFLKYIKNYVHTVISNQAGIWAPQQINIDFQSVFTANRCLLIKLKDNPFVF